MEWYEAAFDRLYPVMYPHRDSGEAQRAVDTFAPALIGRGPLLDLASGGGRYMEALLQRDIPAFGLDLSIYLLQQSVQLDGVRGRVAQGDMRYLPFLDNTFGAVMNMFTSFGYFSVDTDNLRVFREVARVLKPGGTFLFDFINAEKIAGSLLEETRRSSGDYDIHEKRSIEDHGKYLVKRATLDNRRSGARETIEERLRLYSRADLVTMLNSVNLAPREFYGDYDGNEFVDGVSERVIIMSHK